MSRNKLGIGVEVDEGGAVKKINGISKAFDKLGGKGSGASLFGNVGAKAVAVGFNLIGDAAGAATGFLEGAVTAAIEDQSSMAVLSQLLKNNIPNWDGNTTAINAYIDAQTARGFVDDDTRASLGQLIGITHDVTKAQDLNTLAEDLARAKHISLGEATDIVTKAAQGNGKALKALGIDVKKGSDAAAILDSIQKNVKGSADNWNTTMEGKLNKSQVAFNEAVEKIGYTLLPVLSDIMQKFSDDWLPALGRGWDKVNTALKPVFDMIGWMAGRIADLVGWIQKMIDKLKKLGALNIAFPPIPGLPMPKFAEGSSFVPFTGPAIVHRGERIIPASQNKGGMGVTIQGVSPRDLDRIIDQRLFVQIRRAAPGNA